MKKNWYINFKVGAGAGAGAGAGSRISKYGSPEPEPHQNYTAPTPWIKISNRRQGSKGIKQLHKYIDIYI